MNALVFGAGKSGAAAAALLRRVAAPVGRDKRGRSRWGGGRLARK